MYGNGDVLVDHTSNNKKILRIMKNFQDQHSSRMLQIVIFKTFRKKIYFWIETVTNSIWNKADEFDISHSPYPFEVE